MVLRWATSEDFEAVCALYDQLACIHAQALPHFFRPGEAPALSRERFTALLANENAALFVAESQQAIIGMVHCYVHTTPAVSVVVPRRFVHIEDLIVSEHVRQHGVGQVLIERVHQWANEQGVTEIELDVWEFPTPALSFYQKPGYQATRRHMHRQLS
jgi:ribosomal protein S18 acetylase RimI-like enzyme